MTRWRLSIDPDRCVGTGMCAGLAPRYFSHAAGRSTVTGEPVDPDDLILAAAECCPAEAITIVEAGTGRTVYPES